MKKNILMVGAYPPKQIGGGESQLQTLSKMLNERGHKVSVLSMGTRKNIQVKTDDGIKIYRVGKFQKDRKGELNLLQVLKYVTIEIFNPLLFIFTIYLILRHRIKTVHIITYNQLSLSPLIASKMLMRNVIVTMHTQELLCSHSTIMPFCYGIKKGRCGECMSLEHKFPKRVKRFKRALLWLSNLLTGSIVSLKMQLTNRLADTIVFPSDYSKRLHIGYGVRKEKAKVIPCFLDISEPQIEITDELTRKFKPRGKRVILYIGKIIEEKGIEILILSLKEVLKSVKGWKLLVVGRGRSSQKMKNLSRKLKISKYVEFVGAVPHSHIFSYYRISDIVVIPSIVPETFSIALSEAILSKKIIICSRIGALEERVSDGRNGFLVEPNDAEGLADKIVFVLKNQKKLKRLGENERTSRKLKRESDQSFLEYLKLIEGG